MQPQTASGFTNAAYAAKNRRIIARYLNTDGNMKDMHFDLGYEPDRIKVQKLMFWAAVNLVEIRLIPNP